MKNELVMEHTRTVILT